MKIENISLYFDIVQNNIAAGPTSFGGIAGICKPEGKAIISNVLVLGIVEINDKVSIYNTIFGSIFAQLSKTAIVSRCFVKQHVVIKAGWIHYGGFIGSKTGIDA